MSLSSQLLFIPAVSHPPAIQHHSRLWIKMLKYPIKRDTANAQTHRWGTRFCRPPHSFLSSLLAKPISLLKWQNVSREGNLIHTRFLSESYRVLSLSTFISFPCDSNNGKSLFLCSLLSLSVRPSSSCRILFLVLNYSVCYHTYNKTRDLHYCWWLSLFHVFSVLSFPYQRASNTLNSLYFSIQFPLISTLKRIEAFKEGISISEQQFVWKQSP